MLNCLIIEDEPLAQQILSAYIAQTPGLALAHICCNAVEAFETLQHHSIDVMFLDIKMPKLNGMTFLKALKNPPAVIFVTAYSEYAVESYEWQAIDYLVKPVTYERFCKSIQKLLKVSAADQVDNKADSIFIKVDGKLVKIAYALLKYIEAKKDYLKVVTGERSYLTHMTMKTMETVLPADQFTRVHRSFIVSIFSITTLGNEEIGIGQKMIPVGSHYKTGVQKIKLNMDLYHKKSEK